MSIMCCVYVPEGIVLAADSRLTKTKRQEIQIIDTDIKSPVPQIGILDTAYTLSDNTQKVILIKKANVGITFCGEAIVGRSTVADFIRKFEIEMVTENDTTETITKKLAQYYNDNRTHFFVAGYDDDIPYVFDLNNGIIKRQNMTSFKTIDNMVREKLENDEDIEKDTGIPENVKEIYHIGIEKTDKEDVISQLLYGSAWAGQMTAITKVVNNAPTLNVDWNTMPLKDAADLAEFMIDTTIKYERFCDDIQTCGGESDILIITKDEAFWKQHKIYKPNR